MPLCKGHITQIWVGVRLITPGKWKGVVDNDWLAATRRCS